MTLNQASRIFFKIGLDGEFIYFFMTQQMNTQLKQNLKN